MKKLSLNNCQLQGREELLRLFINSPQSLDTLSLRENTFNNITIEAFMDIEKENEALEIDLRGNSGITPFVSLKNKPSYVKLKHDEEK